MLARSGDRSLLGCRLLSVSSQAEGLRELREISFIKALIPFSGTPPSGPNHLPKAPTADGTTLGVRIPTDEFWGTQAFRPLHRISLFDRLRPCTHWPPRSLG